MHFNRHSVKIVGCLLVSFVLAQQASADQRIETIAQVKPAIVAIASFHRTRVPALKFAGSGFIVADGLTVVTNAHVVDAIGKESPDEVLGIVSGSGETQGFREAKLVNTDRSHDLAQLKIAGMPLPILKIGNSDNVKEGQSLLFTGFPLGMVLGFHHATHRTMVSAITSIATPAARAHGLHAKTIKRMRDTPYHVFQLDGTAYPGNSGSPLYDPESGEVYGIVNKVFIKGTKETALSEPSGITYAIPAKFILDLLEKPHE